MKTKNQNEIKKIIIKWSHDHVLHLIGYISRSWVPYVSSLELKPFPFENRKQTLPWYCFCFQTHCQFFWYARGLDWITFITISWCVIGLLQIWKDDVIFFNPDRSVILLLYLFYLCLSFQMQFFYLYIYLSDYFATGKYASDEQNHKDDIWIDMKSYSRFQAFFHIQARQRRLHTLEEDWIWMRIKNLNFNMNPLT